MEERTEGAFLFTKLVFSIANRAAATAPQQQHQTMLMKIQSWRGLCFSNSLSLLSSSHCAIACRGKEKKTKGA